MEIAISLSYREMYLMKSARVSKATYPSKQQGHLNFGKSEVVFTLVIKVNKLFLVCFHVTVFYSERNNLREIDVHRILYYGCCETVNYY